MLKNIGGVLLNMISFVFTARSIKVSFFAKMILLLLLYALILNLFIEKGVEWFIWTFRVLV